jgi:hypothetical protein
MNADDASAAALDMEEIRQELEQFRSTHRPRCRIPTRLWTRHTVWEPTSNQWKNLVETKIEVKGTFVQSGKYRMRRRAWSLVTWGTALPSPLKIELPNDFEQLV